jgi:Zinc-binding dehydrogenase
MPVPNAPPRKREMTDADLALIQDNVERELEAARRALAKRGLPDDGTALSNAAEDRQLTDFLLARGIKELHKITDEERRAFRLAAAASTKNSASAILQRNAGELIDTPAVDAPPDGAVGPRLTEATLDVRWFTELHGDMHVSAIKRDHVRRYREALAKVPPKLSGKQRATKLPQLLKALPHGGRGGHRLRKRRCCEEGPVPHERRRRGPGGGQCRRADLAVIAAIGRTGRASRDLRLDQRSSSLADIQRLLVRQLNVHGSTTGNLDEFHRLIRAFETGAFRPHIDSTFALDEVPAAFERLEHPARLGKVVIKIS